MPFVKLDCGILDSTLWIDRDCREVFITALLMAQPFELKVPAKQLEARSTQETGWTIPPGWYGFVEAAGVGIIRRAGIDHDAGLAALDRLGSPEAESRSPDHEGRRLVRVPGGYLVLNFFKYRDRDYTGADRARRYRQRQAEKQAASHRDVMPSRRDITQAEAEAEAISKNCPTDSGARKRALRTCPDDFIVTEELRQWAVKSFPGIDIDRETEVFRDYTFATGKTDWVRTWRNWMRKAKPVNGRRLTKYEETMAELNRRSANRDTAAAGSPVGALGTDLWPQVSGPVRPGTERSVARSNGTDDARSGQVCLPKAG